MISPIAPPSGAARSRAFSAEEPGEPGLRFGAWDWALVAGLLAIVAFLAVRQVNASHPPVEDAAMLLRYSANFAQTGTISWNLHGPPVEGATDFLYMAAIAALTALTHAKVLLVARVLLFLSSLALVAVVFLAARISFHAHRWIAFALGLYTACAGLALYIRSGFGAPFLMLLVALATWAGATMMAGGEDIGWKRALGFSLLALLVGLTRPEANFLMLLLLAAMVVVRGRAASVRLIVTFAAIFGVLGGAYFAWRWHYFGYPLPNPFYVKGGGHLHFHGLSTSLKNVSLMLLPLVPLALPGLEYPRTRRLLAAMLLPVAGYAALFILLSPENNFLMRFQAPVLPMALVFVPLLWSALPAGTVSTWKRSRRSLGGICAAYTAFACVYAQMLYQERDYPTSAMAFAQHLSQYKDRGYILATTEAGDFPLFSGWNAIDALGLNDVEIAHHGLSAAYLERAQPEVILYHDTAPRIASGITASEDRAQATRFVDALRVMHTYAVEHGYILAAAYGGEPCSLHVFYVRPGTPDTEAIVRYLRETPYYFLDDGALSMDYRDGVRAECGLPDLGAQPGTAIP